MKIRFDNFGNLINDFLCYADGDENLGDGGALGGDPGPADDGGSGDNNPDGGMGADPVPGATNDVQETQVAYAKDPKNPDPRWIKDIKAKGGKTQLPSDEVQALLNFKPKAAKNTDQAPEQAKPAAKAQAPKIDPKTGKPVKAQPTQSGKSQTPQAQVKTPPAQVDPLTKAAQALETAATKLGQPQPAPQPDPHAQPEPKSWYGDVAGNKAHTPQLDIPDQVMEMIDSEDPGIRHQGLNVVVNGVANTIMRDVTEKIVPWVMQNMMKQIPQVIHQQSAARESHQSFYEKYPTLNNEAVKPVLDGLGRQLAPQWQAEGKAVVDAQGRMTPEFMDAVAASFYALTGSTPQPAPAISQQTPGQAPAPVVQQPQQNSQVRQPFFSSKSARPPASGSGQIKSAEIMQTIRS